MALKFTVFKRATACRRDALVCDIAARCAADVARHLRTSAKQMDAAQLRGYLRARSVSVVWSAVRQAIADGQLPGGQVRELVDSVVERTVHLVIRELQMPPVVAIPAAHLPMRSAA